MTRATVAPPVEDHRSIGNVAAPSRACIGVLRAAVASAAASAPARGNTAKLAERSVLVVRAPGSVAEASDGDCDNPVPLARHSGCVTGAQACDPGQTAGALSDSAGPACDPARVTRQMVGLVDASVIAT
ncbi:MAG: hypothetical protein IPK85_09165 [Gemmatimonadetes bacterium]|nr:hypothetical protein [Gemmatimonadota bacterium]